MKILSIDFDIIMYPCIRLYNAEVGGDDNPTLAWERIEYTRDIAQHLNYDAKILNNILTLMMKNAQNGAIFVPIQEHQEIVTYLEKTVGIEKNKDLQVTNIDFHHDIIYHDGDIVNTKYFGQSTCANWAGYLLMNDYANSVNWIKAPNSEVLSPMLANLVDMTKITISPSHSIAELPYDYDYIFFCLSPQWVPYKFHHLYDLCCTVVTMFQEACSKDVEVFVENIIRCDATEEIEDATLHAEVAQVDDEIVCAEVSVDSDVSEE